MTQGIDMTQEWETMKAQFLDAVVSAAVARLEAMNKEMWEQAKAAADMR